MTSGRSTIGRSFSLLSISQFVIWSITVRISGSFASKLKNSCWFGLCVYALLVGLWAGSARADGIHGGDIELEIEDGKLVTHNGRYFESELTGTDPGPYVSEAPGFDSLPGLLTPTEQIGFNVLQSLLYWDGEELAAPGSGVGLSLLFGSNSRVVTQASGSQAGFSLGGGGLDEDENYVGDFHKHFDFVLSSGAPVGAYGVLLQLTPIDTSRFVASDPFLLVFNRGLGHEEFEAGVDAMVQVTAVPEPSSVALAGLGVAGLAGAALRRRMRKQ
jgi:hypothetical protein